MKNKKTFILVVMALILSAMALVTMPAHAGDRVTLGDVTSLFQAWNNGSIAASSNDGSTSGNFDDPFNAAILPFDFLEGAHYCEEDYLLAMLAWFGSDIESFSDFADSLTQTFIIDGQTYPAQRTAIKHRAGGGFGLNEGVILEPGDLAPGSHTFEMIVYIDGVVDWEPSVNFFIDAAGTGVCQ